MSANEPMIYGGTYHIQNDFNGWQGGYLDTCDNADKPNKYKVSTSNSSDRASNSGSWKIVSASGKANGTPVLYNDIFHLQNQFNGNGGYLDTCGNAATPNKYQVSTSDSRDRASGSGKWKIMSATGKANGTPVVYNDVFHLQNLFNNGNGGYLDTCGNAATPNKYDVSTSDSSNRASGSGNWRFVKGTQSPSPSTFQLKVPTNSQTGVEFTNTSSTQVSYKFTPSGTWKPKADIPDCTAAGLKGFAPEIQTPLIEALKPYEENLKYPDNTTFALLAVNKTTGVVTEVGQETTIVLKAGEKLTFLVNDFAPNYGDNTGTLTVQWSVS